MNTIIIPTDFSPAAINAMNYALDMARATNAGVLLFHVYSIPVSVTETPIALISVDELHQAAVSQMDIMRKKVEHITSGEIPIATETRLGNLTDELDIICEKIQPLSVVMGSRGSSGLDNLFGSNTLSAVRNLKWPVIAVPVGKEYGTGIKKIGFASDLENIEETTPAGIINGITQQFNAELHVLNVNTDQHFAQHHHEELDQLKALLAPSKPSFDFIQNEDVDQGISEFAEKNNLDLIILVPKKQKFFDTLFRRSSTKQLVFHSHIPVMCIHS